MITRNFYVSKSKRLFPLPNNGWDEWNLEVSFWLGLQVMYAGRICGNSLVCVDHNGNVDVAE